MNGTTIVVIEQWDGFRAYVKGRPQEGHGPTMEHAIEDLMIQCSRASRHEWVSRFWPEIPRVKRRRPRLAVDTLNFTPTGDDRK